MWFYCIMSWYILKTISDLSVTCEIQRNSSWLPEALWWPSRPFSITPWTLISLIQTEDWIFFSSSCWAGIKNVWDLVVVRLCEKGSFFLPVESRSGWSGQFCVTDVPAGVSSQHNKPSHMRPQKVPWKENVTLPSPWNNDINHILLQNPPPHNIIAPVMLF